MPVVSGDEPQAIGCKFLILQWAKPMGQEWAKPIRLDGLSVNLQSIYSQDMKGRLGNLSCSYALFYLVN